MNRREASTGLLLLLWMFVGSCEVFGQAPPTILTIDLANHVEYYEDVPITSYATNPALTTQSTGNGKNFFTIVIIADIVSINGQPAKGIYISRNRVVSASPTPAPGTGIGDTPVTAFRDDIFKILQADGTPLGSITASGLSGGVPSPGGPLSQTGGDWAITGGTGAFLGVRGEMGGTGVQKGGRPASMAEDPANRRSLGGGTFEFVLYLIPTSSPQILTSADGPAVVHSSDFSLVTPTKPASPGELLSLFATGLGPVRGAVGPGQPFPAVPPATVNSPVQITVNGEPAAVTAAVGYPGSTNGYQLNFQLPSDTAKGAAAIVLSAAWFAAQPIAITVQ